MIVRVYTSEVHSIQVALAREKATASDLLEVVALYCSLQDQICAIDASRCCILLLSPPYEVSSDDTIVVHPSTPLSSILHDTSADMRVFALGIQAQQRVRSRSLCRAPVSLCEAPASPKSDVTASQQQHSPALDEEHAYGWFSNHETLVSTAKALSKRNGKSSCDSLTSLSYSLDGEKAMRINAELDTANNNIAYCSSSSCSESDAAAASSAIEPPPPPVDATEDHAPVSDEAIDAVPSEDKAAEAPPESDNQTTDIAVTGIAATQPIIAPPILPSSESSSDDSSDSSAEESDGEADDTSDTSSTASATEAISESSSDSSDEETTPLSTPAVGHKRTHTPVNDTEALKALLFKPPPLKSPSHFLPAAVSTRSKTNKKNKAVVPAVKPPAAKKARK